MEVTRLCLLHVSYKLEVQYSSNERVSVEGVNKGCESIKGRKKRETKGKRASESGRVWSQWERVHGGL